ncbi:MAG: hypothetical protein LH649_03550 [Pseudanabaena sp. CAN_BIN31]|nr:hypothetical protein [Pseudanabaena sp. CAN_BIN31]
MIYIDKSGKLVLENQKEVLDFLIFHKEKTRYIPAAVDHGEEVVIAKLVNALKTWLNSQAVKTEIMEDGLVKTTMGNAKSALFAGLKKGDKAALETVKQSIKINEKFQVNSFDLVAWLLVSKGA